jgi:hypothetical protein
MIFGIVFVGIGAYFAVAQTQSKGSCIPPTNKVKFAHRSWTPKYQENSLEAILEAPKNGYAPEFDLYMTSTNEIILIHDEDALRVTGIDLDVTTATMAQINSLKYLTTINGYSYTTQPNITTFKAAVDGLCAANPSQAMDIDIKFDLTEANSKILFDILDNSACKCDDSQYLIFASPYFYQMSTFRSIMNTRRCKGKIALWFYPNVYPLGEYFWMKTRASIYIGKPDVISVYDRIWAANPEVVEDLAKDGYCTAVYGNYTNILDTFNYNSYTVNDASSASYDDVAYTSNESIYKLLIALFILAALSLAVSLFAIVWKCCSKKNSKVA